jgi:SAM-dependent methyltransferase
LAILPQLPTCHHAIKDNAIYVQYGCGWSAPDGWANFDASPTLRFERLPLLGRLFTRNAERFPANVRVGDVVAGLPVPDRSCDGVYASHVLEHLARDDFDAALDETLRILKPGGIFRLVVPDLEFAARTYVDAAANGDPAACDRFMRASSLGVERRRTGLSAPFVAWLGNSRHLWMWDYAGLAAALMAHGFDAIRRGAFNDCEDPAFCAVEQADRFDLAVCVEARRPA